MPDPTELADSRASTRQTPPGDVLVTAALLGLIGWLVVASYNLGSILEVALPFLLALGYAAVAVARGKWTPHWLARLADRNRDLAWLLPRLVLATIAVSVIVIGSSYQPPLPTCPERSNGYYGGALLHASVNGDTLVCRYSGGGGL